MLAGPPSLTFPPPPASDRLLPVPDGPPTATGRHGGARQVLIHYPLIGSPGISLLPSSSRTPLPCPLPPTSTFPCQVPHLLLPGVLQGEGLPLRRLRRPSRHPGVER